MKVLIDAFGSDNPNEVISGIADAINEIPSIDVVVAGNKGYIEQVLKNVKFDRSRLEFIDATEVITNDDSPVLSIRKKNNSSLVKAYEALRDREDIPVMISAGNTGAVIAGAVLVLGRIDRHDKPTLVSMLPTTKGGTACLADCGANVDSRPEHLVQYAKYASDYMQKVFGIANPRVALLSIGAEDTKGNAQIKETFPLLKDSGLNFIGNIEARTVLDGDADVIVADGFSGNILLKSIEGTARNVVMSFTNLLKKHAPENTDLSFVKDAITEFNSTYDFNTMGAAILLGLRKPILKAHGAANSKTIVNTVKQAAKILESLK